jgi:hypothetical protein
MVTLYDTNKKGKVIEIIAISDHDNKYFFSLKVANIEQLKGVSLEIQGLVKSYEQIEEDLISKEQ